MGTECSLIPFRITTRRLSPSVSSLQSYAPGPGLAFVAYDPRIEFPKETVGSVLLVESTICPVPPNARGPIAAGPGDSIP